MRNVYYNACAQRSSCCGRDTRTTCAHTYTHQHAFLSGVLWREMSGLARYVEPKARVFTVSKVALF